jgi:hypothetical protein
MLYIVGTNIAWALYMLALYFYKEKRVLILCVFITVLVAQLNFIKNYNLGNLSLFCRAIPPIVG